MTTEGNKQIIDFIDRLTREIALARKLSLKHTALLLEIAKLDLTTIIHDISDEEVRDFSMLIREPVRVRHEAGLAHLQQRMKPLLREPTQKDDRP